MNTMTTRALLAFTILPLALLAGACGHTNKLAQHNIADKTALFRSFTTSNVTSGVAEVESPGEHETVDLLAAIGSVIITEQARNKLENAFNGDSVAHDISLGIRNATADYLNIRPVQSMADNPDLIIETKLIECQLVSGASGITLQVEGESRVIERKTGIVVWDDSETYMIPLSETYLSVAAPTAISSGASIFNAVRLMRLSEEELRRVASNAATDAGREIGEMLRKDVAKLRN